MKTMWKKAIGIICAGGLSVVCLAGCGKDAASSPGIPMQEIQQNNAVDGEQVNKESDDSLEHGADNNEADQQNNVADGAQANKENDASLEQEVNNNVVDDGASGSMGDGEFYDGANLQGSVVEFSDEGFSLSPATTETEAGGGEILTETVPGAENNEDNIQITYTDNTVFQIVNFSLSSQSEISREDTDKESVKKQSSVCVFGSCQDTYHWTADKVLIFRYQ